MFLKLQINKLLNKLLFWSFYSSKNISMLIIRNICAPNQQITMISEGSCDTEDWSNDAKNSILPSQK